MDRLSVHTAYICCYARNSPVPREGGVAWERGYARSILVPREGVWPGNEAMLEVSSFPGRGCGLGTRLC